MKRKLVILRELWRVQTINYFSEPSNWVFGLLMTVITMVCWIAFRRDLTGFQTDNFLLASAIGVSIIRNSQFNLAFSIGDWKERKLYSRLVYTPISKRLFGFSVITFNWVINLLFSFILFGIAMIFQSQREILVDVQWFPFTFGFIVNVLLSNVMAIFWTRILKTRLMSTIFANISYFVSMYMLGLSLPWGVVGNLPILNIILYLAPHRYPIAIMQAAWVGNANDMSFPLLGMADISPDSWLGIHGFGFGTNGWWVPLLATIGWIAIFGITSLMLIKRSLSLGQRDIRTYPGIEVHFSTINKISRAQSLSELKKTIKEIETDRDMTFITTKKANLNKKKSGGKS